MKLNLLSRREYMRCETCGKYEWCKPIRTTVRGLPFLPPLSVMGSKKLSFYKVFDALGFKKLSFYTVFGVLGFKKTKKA